MKRILLLILIVIIFLCSCNHKAETSYPNFPGTHWNMSYSEVLDALKLSEKDIQSNADKSFFTLQNYELFKERSQEIVFYFLNWESDSMLWRIDVTYPEETDMGTVRKQMKKMYGEPVPKLTLFSYYLPIETSLSSEKFVETDHLNLWTDKISLLERIPEKEREKYRQLWSKYLPPIKEDANWNDFTGNGSMVNILWTDNNEITNLMIHTDQKNNLCFVASNAVMFHVIQKEVSDQE